jgi:hypothetical protein
MIWITWRQHRAALIGLTAFLTLPAGYALETGLSARGTGVSIQSLCLPIPRMTQCETTTLTRLRVEELTALVPALVGVFLGAPLLAREYATGTTRLAWTQGTERTRLIAVKLSLLGLAVLVVAGLLGWLTQWSTQWSTPAGRVIGDDLAGPGQLVSFGATPLILAGSAVLALAIGVLAGALIRRVVPAMAATATVIAILALLRWDQLTPGHAAFWLGYRPGHGYWRFQSVQGGTELLLALLLGALAVWLVRRRNA